MRSLSLAEARRLAVMSQQLAGARPRGILDVVSRLTRVQVDPTAIVERAERLTLWSRLGAYDRDELRRLLEDEPRRLFEYNAYLLAVDDLPLHRPFMRRYPPTDYTRGRYIARWLADNRAFRAYIVGELRRRGPLRSRDLDDRAEVPWQTGGWNDGKNLGRMLEIMWLSGDIAIVRRDGSERVWDLAERVLPLDDVEELPDELVAVESLDRQLRAQGMARRDFGATVDLARLRQRDAGIESLLADGLAVPVRVAGLDGEWLAHRDALTELDGGAWQPRTTLLGPFDPLIHDRERTLALFGFAFKFELYVPAARRQYGPYTLAILHGDRLVGRLDSAVDRRRGTFEVRGAWAEPDAPPRAWPEVRAAVEDLAAWVGAGDVSWPPLPEPWQADGALSGVARR
ncbi:MAG TPA: crosslink repair DNA glycosylase YcaQ family protein [Candidatus Limnocylindria bacterium]|nr:crosslink repair DNA glycosylase YcaQ family protein [Candidatus Limnocylindria bacterium]